MCLISVTMKGLSLKKQSACPGHPPWHTPTKKRSPATVGDRTPATKHKTATTYSPTKRQYHRRDEA